MSKTGSILIVDDNEEFLVALKLMLSPHFAKVITINQPDLILSRVEKEDFDVILLDMNFRAGINTGNEGLFWLKKIKEVDKDATIVFITAYGDVQLAVKSVKEGAADFIQKSWDEKKILSTVLSAYQLSNSKSEIKKLKSKQQHLSDSIHNGFQLCKGPAKSMQLIYDMVNKVALWKNDRRVAQKIVRINHPLIYDGLVILPASFGQELQGFRFHMPGIGFVDLTPGSRLSVSSGLSLAVDNFLPDAGRDRQGRVIPVGSRLNNPALQLSLFGPTGTIWQGWYFLRRPLPEGLVNAGIYLKPVEPVLTPFSLLTINRDPGDKTALAGGVCITVGVLFAFFSFYRKRATGDRPEI